MARPKKQTVDYFPHDCDASEGRTLTILQFKYGNDGYAFWFKLLQLLGKSLGHYYDYNDNSRWEFLLAKTGVSEDTANSILSTLTDLGAIDRELAKKKIIWIQHFVDNVADVYKRRAVDLPIKPGGVQPEPDEVKRGEAPLIEPATDDLKVASMIKYYEDTKGRVPTPLDLERLKDFADTYPDGWYEKALADYPAKPLTYIAKVMENWKEEGVNPLDRRRTGTHQGQPTTTTKLRESTTKKLR